MEHVALLGVIVFASTNLDDILVLMLFFADHQFKPVQVVMGQYAGIGLLIVLSIVGSLAALVIPVQLLGLLPLGLGLKKIYDLFTSPPDPLSEASERGDLAPTFGVRMLSVAAVTLANGGDNIGIYTPLFATTTPFQLGLLILIFLLMTALWCAMGYFVIQRTAAGEAIQRFGKFALPFVLISLGLWIIVEN